MSLGNKVESAETVYVPPYKPIRLASMLINRILKFGKNFRGRLDPFLRQGALKYTAYNEESLDFEVLCDHVREYDIQGAVDNMRASGASVEEVAKYAYSARNELKLKYRQYTPPEMLDIIDKRNLERYGNKIGPEFDDLVKKGKAFDQIIESSTRAGGGDLF